MKKTKIIVPALAVLLLSTAASVTGTVAWFSMNNQVTVTGMTVTTNVSSNLLIAETNLEENYQESITQARSGVLEPASTVDGINFYYTTSAKGDGDAKTDNYTKYNENTALNNIANAGKANVDQAFNNAYGILPANIDVDNVYYGYIDYSFYIKATSAADDQVLYMSKCNLLYDTQDYEQNPSGSPVWSSVSDGYAWRVGLLATTATKNTAADDSGLALKTTLGLAQSKNQNQLYAELDTTGYTAQANPDMSAYYLDKYGNSQASGAFVPGTKYYVANNNAPQAVNSATTLANVGNPGKPAHARDNIDSGTTTYTRIVVRLWLEGEDISCTSNTYAELTSSWKLDLEFKLGDAVEENEAVVGPGVKLIGSVAA